MASRESTTGDRFDLVVRGTRVVGPDGVAPREVGVVDGVITAVEPLGTGLPGRTVIELARDEALIPGLVDAHVHVNEPGRTDWEGFASATRAAAAGGVTSILDMPLNSVPATVDAAALALKRRVAAPQVFVDVGFWGGAVPTNLGELRALHDDGVFGFKCFLLPSGVHEFPHLELDELETFLTALARLGAMMIVHAEHPGAVLGPASTPDRDYRHYLASRPRQTEDGAVAEVVERTRRTGARSHIVHLSSADSLPVIRAAQHDGVDLTAETCPHYLTLVAEDVPAGATAFKCCPPIRESANREALWEGLLDGTIEYIASDHSPSTPDLKHLDDGDFGAAWGGISSIQLGLPIVWTEARRRGIGLERVVDWMAARPADRAGVRGKGRLAVGYDADLVVLAPEEQFVVRAQRLHHKNPLTPYEGRTLHGVVRRTFVRGVEVDLAQPRGRLLRRGG
ncbi:allantoinase AllB [Georgenia sp. MJ170]|uniref:allantoinase AllB n=1 Tax=Georgenia sunbinii TaxID=3117728 RepID=UPI002F26BCAF